VTPPRGHELVAAAERLRAQHGAPRRSRADHGRFAYTDEGLSWDQIAARLGVGPKTLEKARERARRRRGA
jgi:hypothetical protein